MKEMKLISYRSEDLKLCCLLSGLLLLWYITQRFASLFDPSAGMIAPGIWQLILLALICFLLVIALSWWLARQLWQNLGLPSIEKMVSQFHTLASWQQQKLYWSSFALLLLTAIGVLSAIL